MSEFSYLLTQGASQDEINELAELLHALDDEEGGEEV